MTKLITALSVLFCLMVSFQMNAQGKDYLDYIVTQNDDTIYGTFRLKLFKTILLEKNKDLKKDTTKFYSHSIRDIKSYRFSDFVNVPEQKEDGIYQPSSDSDKNIVQRQIKSDYVVSQEDTIYGKISVPFLAEYKILTTSKGRKIKIKYPEVLSYFLRNATYDYKIREKFVRYEKKSEYLERLYPENGMTLYGTRKSGMKVYYIEKNNKVFLFKMSDVENLFGDDKELMNLIYEGVYAYDNIYLMFKFYFRPKS